MQKSEGGVRRSGRRTALGQASQSNQVSAWYYKTNSNIKFLLGAGGLNLHIILIVIIYFCDVKNKSAQAMMYVHFFAKTS